MNKWLKSLKTPCYVINEAALINNLKTLSDLEISTGCKVLLAQKAFSAFAFYPLVAKYISGTTASGIFEARLAHEEMQNKENHVYSPAYKEDELKELVKICDHIIFNSPEQWQKFKKLIPENVSAGLRINPELSTQGGGIYDPCAPFSRLGSTLKNIQGKDLGGIEGLHFHTLCEQDSDALEVTLDEVIKKFGDLFPMLKWVNLGGGHHITREGYDIRRLEKCIERVMKYGLDVYIEPGEAVALNAGWLAASVLDIINHVGDDERRMILAVLDASAACHMPDVLEMPYTPKIIGAKEKGEGKFNYRFTGNTCLAGDIIGDYSFEYELKEGDKLLFCDMAIYSMVKNNTFNGIPLPSIAVLRENGELETIKHFGYSDFKNRLS
ncbi:MAG: carboxynorspermidine decarboxylase [Oscillospiraceae bacterium]|nr:carboxynorspermidine decarboxylase [Oscillospiraceae bacterium]